jgi:hypothetical protein
VFRLREFEIVICVTGSTAKGCCAKVWLIGVLKVEKGKWFRWGKRLSFYRRLSLGLLNNL